jgi:tetratricopeptide (TPR) repeat protein
MSPTCWRHGRLPRCSCPKFRAARALFKSSLNQDLHFAPAFGGVARTLIMEWLLLQRGEPDLLDEAERHARRALALDPQSADGLRELGLCSLYRGHFDESLEAFDEAERRAPHHADLIADHADALSLAGRSADALQKIEQATALNPLGPDRYRWYEGTILYQLERYGDAIRALSLMADSTPAYKLLAASWAMLDEPAAARRYATEVRRIYPDFKVEKWLAMIPIRDAAVRQRYETGLRAAGFE